jgi:hypothetical protein
VGRQRGGRLSAIVDDTLIRDRPLDSEHTLVRTTKDKTARMRGSARRVAPAAPDSLQTRRAREARSPLVRSVWVLREQSVAVDHSGGEVDELAVVDP